MRQQGVRNLGARTQAKPSIVRFTAAVRRVARHWFPRAPYIIQKLVGPAPALAVAKHFIVSAVIAGGIPALDTCMHRVRTKVDTSVIRQAGGSRRSPSELIIRPRELVTRALRSSIPLGTQWKDRHGSGGRSPFLGIVLQRRG